MHSGRSLFLKIVCSVFFWLLCLPAVGAASGTTLTGTPQQGGLIFGQTDPQNQVQLDELGVVVSESGHFVIGFSRDETGQKILVITDPNGQEERHSLVISKRQYDIERVDGLPPSTVTPDPSALKRIREEAAMVSAARSRRDNRTDYVKGFDWPATGRISGVYGSQRILNGEPRNPHFGLDIAAPEGSPVYAPANGIVTLAHDDLYYSGGTIILDHGQGLSSTFLHLSKILVESGTKVQKGDLIAEIGATGRASGPHLDWRMNWLDKRVDPHLLVKDKEQTTVTP